MKQIVDIQLERLRARLAERHITLELTDRAREHIAAVGYDPSYGARPLKRAIQKEIETPLGRLLLKGESKDGQTVIVDYDRASGALQIHRQEPAAGVQSETRNADSMTSASGSLEQQAILRDLVEEQP